MSVAPISIAMEKNVMTFLPKQSSRTAAADKFTASHQLQAPSFRIGTNDLNYVVLTYDDTNNQFVVTRKKSGSADVSNPITFA